MDGIKPHDSYDGGEVRYHDVDAGFTTPDIEKSAVNFGS
jgi:hypothetical protein